MWTTTVYVFILYFTHSVMASDRKWRLDRLENDMYKLRGELAFLKAKESRTNRQLTQLRNQLEHNGFSQYRSTLGNGTATFLAYGFGLNGGARLQKQSGEIIAFTSAVVNPAGHYNSTMGIYTCPINGLYYFSVSMLANYTSIIALMKDTEQFAGAMWRDGPSRFGNAFGTSVVIPCLAGEHVFVVSKNGASLIDWYYQNIFSGFLIAARSSEE